MPDINECRAEGLRLAVELHSRQDFASGQYGDSAARILADAEQFAVWLESRPHHLTLIPGSETFQQPDYPGPAIPTQTGDDGMAVTMSDTQQVSYAVEAQDSKGQPVSDTLTWSSDDAGAVVTVTPAADGQSCIFAAVDPGTANISVTDGNGLSATDVITVVAGDAATLTLTPGTPTDEAAPSA